MLNYNLIYRPKVPNCGACFPKALSRYVIEGDESGAGSMPIHKRPLRSFLPAAPTEPGGYALVEEL
jgi:hypothetical protein